MRTFPEIDGYRQHLEQLKGERGHVEKSIRVGRKRIKSLKRKVADLEEVLLIIQTVAQATQKKLEYHVAELVTLALEGVFPEPYQLHLDFVLKRKQSEGVLTFSRGGMKGLNPKSSTGGGVVVVAALALRFSLWQLKQPHSRGTFGLDEPFHYINDPTRNLHKKAAAMLRLIADKLGIQLIIPTLCPELIDVADKTFRFTNKRGITQVEEV